MVRPYRPVRELEAHLDRGELDSAIAIARGLPSERAAPLGLDLMLRFLPLVALQRPDDYDVWTLRWLECWCAQARGHVSIDEAAEVVAGLAEIPIDPESALRVIRGVGTGRRIDG
jgi:hypothetical protein